MTLLAPVTAFAVNSSLSVKSDEFKAVPHRCCLIIMTSKPPETFFNTWGLDMS